MENTHFIIGSRLFKELFPNNKKIQQRCKSDSDFDICHMDLNVDKSQFQQKYGHGAKIDLHYNPILFKCLSQITDTNVLKNVFFTLKASHVQFDKVHQKKTFYDLFLMSEERCTVIEPLFWDLTQWWKETLPNKKWRADFEKESTDFFDDAVSRENIHDELHKRVAYYDQPAFKFLQEPDQTTVYVSPEKFWQVTEHIRQRVIIEEAQTLALERLLLPKITTNSHGAYVQFVEGLVDRLAPEWMIPYIINNLHYFLTFKENFYEK